MIVCRTCGGHNADGDTFCGSCGEFLEWTGEKLAVTSGQAEPPVEPIHEVPEQPAPSLRPAVIPEPAPVPPPVPPEPRPGPVAAPGPAPAVTGVPGPDSAPAGPPAAPPAPEPKPSRAGFTPAVGGFRPAVSGSASSAAKTPGTAPKPAGTAAKAGGTGPKAAAPGPKPAGTAPKAVDAGLLRSGNAAQPNGTDPKPGRLDPAQRAAAALVAPPGAGSEPATAPSRSAPPPPARRPQPQEMRPQAPVRRRQPTTPTVPSPPTRRLQPDDLICGKCGEGNPPDRRFCSRCGESLQTATVVPTPWWRKVVQYLRQRRVHSAGARPKRRARLLTLYGVMALVRRTLLVAAVLAALAYAVFPGMRQGVNGAVGSLKDRVVSAVGRQPVKVVPIRTEASAQLPDHPGELATDQFRNTFWVAPDATAGPKLILTFDHPAHLTKAIVHNGGGEDYQALGRPAKLHVVSFDGDSPVGITDVDLEDTPNEQKVAFDTGEGANRVEIEVVGVHRSAQNPGLALSYLELFERPS